MCIGNNHHLCVWSHWNQMRSDFITCWNICNRNSNSNQMQSMVFISIEFYLRAIAYKMLFAETQVTHIISRHCVFIMWLDASWWCRSTVCAQIQSTSMLDRIVECWCLTHFTDFQTVYAIYQKRQIIIERLIQRIQLKQRV